MVCPAHVHQHTSYLSPGENFCWCVEKFIMNAKIGHFCVEKNLSKNLAWGEKMPNMRYAHQLPHFLASPVAPAHTGLTLGLLKIPLLLPNSSTTLQQLVAKCLDRQHQQIAPSGTFCIPWCGPVDGSVAENGANFADSCQSSIPTQIVALTRLHQRCLEPKTSPPEAGIGGTRSSRAYV